MADAASNRRNAHYADKMDFVYVRVAPPAYVALYMLLWFGVIGAGRVTVYEVHSI